MREYRLVAFNARYIHSCPAIFYVRQELKRHLPESVLTLMQWTINDPYYATLLKITENNPAALLFSVYIWNSSYIAKLLRDVKQLLPDSLLILGGPQAGQLLQDNMDISGCVLVTGEVEAVDKSFFNDLAVGTLCQQYETDPERLRNISFLSPFLDSDFQAQLNNRHIYYESSRGCPFTCTYCLSAKDVHVRHKDLSQVKKELHTILVHKPKIVRFIDRTFNDFPERALHIWRFLVEQPGSTLFHFEVAPDRFTEEMFAFLEKLPVNKFQFEIGVQSTNAETLKKVRRVSDIQKATENISRLVKLNTIHLHVDLILGLPGEARAGFIKSFNDVFSMQPHYIQMGLLKILPDTQISKNVAKYSIVFRQEPPYEILASQWMNHEELAELYWFGECVEAFYNNRFFRSVWRYMSKKQEDPFCFFCSLLDVCQKNDFFELAATQDFMCRMLLLLFATRTDKELLRELLVYDWFRSGNRQLPDFLCQENEGYAQGVIKKQLRLELPQNCLGLYEYSGRDHFLKITSFMSLSDEALFSVGLEEDGKRGCVVILRGHSEAVFGLHKTIFLNY